MLGILGWPDTQNSNMLKTVIDSTNFAWYTKKVDVLPLDSNFAMPFILNKSHFQ